MRATRPQVSSRNRRRSGGHRRSRSVNETTDTPFHMERLGTIMEGDPTNPDEVLGVLNPACCRDRNGDLLLFPRIVAAGNYSRIGIARVRCDADGTPAG